MKCVIMTEIIRHKIPGNGLLTCLLISYSVVEFLKPFISLSLTADLPEGKRCSILSPSERRTVEFLNGPVLNALG